MQSSVIADIRAGSVSEFGACGGLASGPLLSSPLHSGLRSWLFGLLSGSETLAGLQHFTHYLPSENSTEADQAQLNNSSYSNILQHMGRHTKHSVITWIRRVFRMALIVLTQCNMHLVRTIRHVKSCWHLMLGFWKKFYAVGISEVYFARNVYF